jgi:hypothetical protein
LAIILPFSSLSKLCSLTAILLSYTLPLGFSVLKSFSGSRSSAITGESLTPWAAAYSVNLNGGAIEKIMTAKATGKKSLVPNRSSLDKAPPMYPVALSAVR